MSKLISSTTFETHGELFETQVSRVATNYEVVQAAPAGAIYNGYETILLNQEQAIQIAKTILRNEGIISA